MWYYVLKVYFYDGSWGYYVNDYYNNLQVSQSLSQAEHFGYSDFICSYRGECVKRDHSDIVSRYEVVKIEE